MTWFGKAMPWLAGKSPGAVTESALHWRHPIPGEIKPASFPDCVKTPRGPARTSLGRRSANSRLHSRSFFDPRRMPRGTR